MAFFKENLPGSLMDVRKTHTHTHTQLVGGSACASVPETLSQKIWGSLSPQEEKAHQSKKAVGVNRYLCVK